jgi:hypothetical protein
MSMPFTVFSCNRCDFGGSSIVNRGASCYQSGEQQAYVNKQLGWCAQCADLCSAENLPTVASITAMAKEYAGLQKVVEDCRSELKTKRSWLAKLFNGSIRLPDEMLYAESDMMDLDNQLQDDRQCIEILKGRQSPARCLTCGSTEITYLPHDYKLLGCPDNPGPPVPIHFLHPGCGGELLAQYSDIRFSLKSVRRFYDTEGNLLSDEENQ